MAHGRISITAVPVSFDPGRKGLYFLEKVELQTKSFVGIQGASFQHPGHWIYWGLPFTKMQENQKRDAGQWRGHSRQNAPRYPKAAPDQTRDGAVQHSLGQQTQRDSR